jgi:HSP20 family molecular chaperone IbpA
MSATEKMPVSMERLANLRADVEQMYERIAARAYEYFIERGCVNGYDIDDWIRAERELLLKPQARLRRQDSDFVIDVDLADINPAEVQIRVTPRQMLVISLALERRQIFQIVRFSETIDSAGVRAGFSDGKLQVIAPIAADSAVA